jgi:hypothetical protein
MTGEVPLLTAMLANPLFGLFVFVLIIAVVLIAAHEEGWCQQHGVTTCAAEWQAGARMVIDKGRSWLQIVAGGERGGGATTIDRPRPVPQPAAPPSRPNNPPKPVEPKPANDPDPETQPQPKPCVNTLCPVPIDTDKDQDDKDSPLYIYRAGGQVAFRSQTSTD